MLCEELENRTTPTTVVQQVVEINAVGLSSNPAEFAAANGRVYFAANDGLNGRELWVTDGSSSGTTLIANIRATGGDSYIRQITNAAGRLFFFASDGLTGTELWTSDGTSSGTRLVRDITPGPTLTSLNLLTAAGNRVYFTVNAGSTGEELWTSDGTSTGTVLVRDIQPGGIGSRPRYLTNVGGVLFFAANDGISGRELWRSDGTSSGTYLLRDLIPGAGYGALTDLVAHNGSLAFFCSNPQGGAGGRSLWRSDGTSVGTSVVYDFLGNVNDPSPNHLHNAAGKLFLAAEAGGNSGIELWSSDGTSAGTTLVANINATRGSYPRDFANAGGRVFFTANGGASGYEVWASDGTSSGTRITRDIGALAPIVATESHAFFLANDVTQGLELWRSDGTSSGTILLRDAIPGPGGQLPSGVPLIATGARVFFAANDVSSGIELWASDGTVTGTARIRDIRTGGTTSPSADPRGISNSNGTLFFTANNGVLGAEVWTSNGTAGGTAFLADTQPGATPAIINSFVPVGNLTYFVSSDAQGDGTLWRSDGTPTGTYPLPAPARPNELTNIGGTLFFTGSFQGTGLWASDGTVAGTRLVHTVRPGNFANLGGVAVFRGNGGAGYELWRSDGTSSGTTIIRDIKPAGGSGPNSFTTLGTRQWALTPMGGRVYFQANDGASGYELWSSDGTSSGTALVRDAATGTGSSSPYGMTTIDGRVFFTANTPATGRELWSTDGTSSGTVLIRDIAPGTVSSIRDNYYGLEFVSAGSKLFFVATESTAGREVWVSDGTSAGTTLVRNIRSGSTDSSPRYLTAVQGSVYFTAVDLTNQRTVWRSTGTFEGTSQLLNNSQPMVRTGNPWFEEYLTNLYLSFDNGLTGRELWAADAPPRVVSVTAIGANGRTAGLQNTNLSLPWAPTSIRVTFTEPVNASTGALSLAGMNLPAVTGVTGNGTNILTWSFSAPVESAYQTTLFGSAVIGSLGIGLDGNSNFTGGDNYQAVTRILAGDFDGNGRTDAIDLSNVRALAATGSYQNRADFDFDADVDTHDVDYLRIRLGRQLPDFSYQPTPPTTAPGVIVSLGEIATSRLTSITLQFDSPVDAAAFDLPGAISLKRQTDGAVLETGTTVNQGRISLSTTFGMVTSIRLAFDNADGALISESVEYGSLADGHWQLSIPALDYLSPSFHRLFGDSNSDGTVDGSTDFAEFGSVFGQTLADSPFDFNGDGVIDGAVDFAQFGDRFGRTL